MSKVTKKNKVQNTEENTEAKKYRRQNIYFNSSNDDLYQHFQKQNDKTSYIMGLIRQDLDKKEQSEQDLSNLKDDVQDLKKMMNQVLTKLDGVSVVETDTQKTEVQLPQEEVSIPKKEEDKIENPGIQVNAGLAGALLDID